MSVRRAWPRGGGRDDAGALRSAQGRVRAFAAARQVQAAPGEKGLWRKPRALHCTTRCRANAALNPRRVWPPRRRLAWLS
eukprot:5116707-Pleurochrysis_carterae.AAC.3